MCMRPSGFVRQKNGDGGQVVWNDPEEGHVHRPPSGVQLSACSCSDREAPSGGGASRSERRHDSTCRPLTGKLHQEASLGSSTVKLHWEASLGSSTGKLHVKLHREAPPGSFTGKLHVKLHREAPPGSSTWSSTGKLHWEAPLGSFTLPTTKHVQRLIFSGSFRSVLRFDLNNKSYHLLNFRS